MSRSILRNAGALSAILFLLSAASFARQPMEPGSTDPTGKYILSGGGYLVISVDDLGRVQGFFERNGEFGRLSGQLDSEMVSATWVQESGARACTERVEGSAYWGRVTLAPTDSSDLSLAWGECGEAPTELQTAR